MQAGFIERAQSGFDYDEVFDAETTLEDLVKPRYELLDRVGAGGMATVSRARQRTVCGFERIVALKRIVPQHADDPAFVNWLIREAKIASALNHPNIIQIYELGRDDRGYFIAMEYLEGQSLHHLVNAAAERRVQVPIEIILAIAGELCDALDHVHHRVNSTDGCPLEIVHRDISFGNLVVTTSGHLKLIDFGVAAARHVPWAGNQLVGKVAYMAPEAIFGAVVDARADLFAVGVVLWQLLCGRKLFRGSDDAATIENLLYGDILPPSAFRSNCPPELDALVLAALARDRDRRSSSAAALRSRIDDIIRVMRIRDTTPAAVARWVATLSGAAPKPCAPELERSSSARGYRAWPTAPSRTAPSADHVGVTRKPVPVRGSQPVPPRRRRRGLALATRIGVAGTLVGGWFTISALQAPVGKLGAAVSRTELSSPDRSGQELAIGAPLPAIATSSRAEEPVASSDRRDDVRDLTRRRRLATPVGHRRPSVALQLPARIEPEPAKELALAPAPVAEIRGLALPAHPMVIPASEPVREAAPLLIPPGRVRQVFGDLGELDSRRLEREGVGPRIATVLCIDEQGKVRSIRYLGGVPPWVQNALSPRLREFAFTPYRVGDKAVGACFTRDLSVTAR